MVSPHVVDEYGVGEAQVLSLLAGVPQDAEWRALVLGRGVLPDDINARTGEEIDVIALQLSFCRLDRGGAIVVQEGQLCQAPGPGITRQQSVLGLYDLHARIPRLAGSGARAVAARGPSVRLVVLRSFRLDRRVVIDFFL